MYDYALTLCSELNIDVEKIVIDKILKNGINTKYNFKLEGNFCIKFHDCPSY